jgi:hypothetical protein
MLKKPFTTEDSEGHGGQLQELLTAKIAKEGREKILKRRGR